MSWQQPHNKTMNCPLTPVLRVNWSKPRCWHGEAVNILVRSSYVKDGGQITLVIYPKGDPNAVDTLAPLAINGNALDHAYTVNWKNKPVPPNAKEFEVKATLANPNVTATSEAMAVDLLPPVFSA